MWGGGGGGGGGGAPGLGLQQTRFDVRGERLLEFRIATLILSEIQQQQFPLENDTNHGLLFDESHYCFHIFKNQVLKQT